MAYLAGLRAEKLPPYEQRKKLLVPLQERRILLVLDGSERELRAYDSVGAAYQGDADSEASSTGASPSKDKQSGRDCNNPLADQVLRSLASLRGVQGKVLMSTRLHPQSIEAQRQKLIRGCLEKELIQIQPEDAVEFFLQQSIAEVL